jgi:hypothetical protein
VVEAERVADLVRQRFGAVLAAVAVEEAPGAVLDRHARLGRSRARRPSSRLKEPPIVLCGSFHSSRLPSPPHCASTPLTAPR